MKKLYLIFIALFAAIIVVPSLWVFASEDTDFSDNENRMLQTAPELNGETVLSGKFQDELNEYITDQFPARDTWTALGSRIKMLAGMKDIGGAYIGEDGYYFEMITPDSVDEAKYLQNLALVKTFAQKYPEIDTTLLLVPATSTVLSDKLPANAETYDAAAMLQLAKTAVPEINIPDAYSALSSHKDEYIYYRTDHHWTTMGAKIAYDCLMDGKGAYKGAPELFSDFFLGTTYSKTLDAKALADEVYTVPVSDKITVNADGTDIPFYFTDAAKEKDKYKVFFGGNYGEVTIRGGAENGKTLLVIKDSFANSLVPYLTADYENIIMLDLRYYMGSIQGLMEQEGVTDVLFVNEMSSFAKDTNIIKLTF
ncbi:MAG: DHHW family protein [Bacillota bacterium]|nr:DHHW family protein [Bacillota bacterium]